jgi:cephalosporin hydroxylase
MNKIEEFKQEVKNRINSYSNHDDFKKSAHDFMRLSIQMNYSYNFTWLGRPIIQYPQDIIALQEIISSTKPDLIIETGIAHGGSLIFSASMQKILNIKGLVVGIDIDIREHNKNEIIENILFKEGRIKLIEGSSISDDIIDEIRKISKSYERIMVILDSNHTHDHVLEELTKYSGFVTKGCYIAVLDTMVEDFDNDIFSEKKWGKGNNPKTAVHEFLNQNNEFEIDASFDNKLLISVAPNGYLIKK